MTPSIEELDSKIRILEAKKAAVFQRFQNAHDLIPGLSDERTREIFATRCETIEESKQEFSRLINEINNTKIKINPKVDISFQEMNAMDDLYCGIKRAKSKFIVTTTPTPSLNKSCSGLDRCKINLPQINIEPFSGVYKKWPSFKQTFNSLVYDNEALSDIEKFHYLKSLITGDAHQVIQAFELTDDQFSAAWQALNDRYNCERLLANSYMMEILKNESVPSRPSTHSLKEFLTTIDANITALKNMNIPDLQDFLCLNLALRKLDCQTRALFEKEHAAENFPRYDDLIKLVKTQCRIFEIASQTTTYTDSGPKLSTRNLKPDAKRTALFTQPEVQDRNNDCPLCHGPHKLYQCGEFIALDVAVRRRKASELRVCYNCLSSLHLGNKCKSTTRCKECKGRHHSLLHFGAGQVRPADTPLSPIPSPSSFHQPPRYPKTAQNTALLTGSPGFSQHIAPSPSTLHQTIASPATETVLSTQSPQVTNVLLGTALAHIKDRRGRFVPARLIIDCAATSSFISTSLVSRLGLSVEPRNQTFAGLGSCQVASSSGLVTCLIKPIHATSPRIHINPVVVNKIVDNLPACYLPVPPHHAYSDILLADPEFHQPHNVDLLLGGDCFMQVLLSGRLPPRPPYPGGLETIFGYVLMGPTSIVPAQPHAHAFLTCQETPSSLEHLLQKFWETEDVTGTVPPAPQDIYCEEHFQTTHRRNKKGRYIVRMPFDGSAPAFPQSKELALRRFYALERRWCRDPALKHECVSFLNEYEALGHMEEASSEGKYVLPYFCVHNPSSPSTKARIVFDGSAKLSDVSLNETLLVGPKLQKEVPELILKFRLHPLVFTCDIVKCYRQILLSDKDRAYTHIYFRESPHLPLKEYQLNTVVYGLAPSAFLAQRVLRQVAHDEGHRFPAAVEILLEDTYLDDIITGASSLSALSRKSDHLVSMLRAGGFELNKWASNSPQFLSNLKGSTTSNCIIFGEDDCDGAFKVLGMQWQPSSDCFSYRYSPYACDRPVTKRRVLSVMARIYDPLGFISPVIFRFKYFLQCLCKQNLQWDSPLTPVLEQQWLELVSDLQSLEQVRIPRFISLVTVANYQLLGFADASEKGYAAMFYLRTSSITGEVKVSLILAKSKIAPLKVMSIPRLELCAAHLLAKMYSSLTPFISRLPEAPAYFFSDSEIVLAWLNKPAHTLKTFVANRVTAILEKTPGVTWRHVRTHTNPADFGSRGLSSSALHAQAEDNLSAVSWFKGPRWALDLPDTWPGTLASHVPDDELPEIKPAPVLLTTCPLTVDWMERFSSLTRLVRTVSYCLRWFNAIAPSPRRQAPPTSLTVMPREWNRALVACAYATQQVHFKAELQNLAVRRSTAKPFSPLSPFLDEQHVIRVGGRLLLSALPQETRHPILLPKHSHLTYLVIDYFHLTLLHAGPRTTLANIRSLFWIISAHSVVRNRIRSCVTCAKFRGETYGPMMGQLPTPRVTPSRPFSHVGVDFSGEFLIKSGPRRNAPAYKAYFALFICMATKAIHLEPVVGLSTESFIACLHRFFSRRGFSAHVYCDQATNFKGAAREISEVADLLATSSTRSAVMNTFVDRRVTFHFIPPRSPFMGGIWEANIKNVKHHLYRIVGVTRLTLDEFSTLLTRIEAILNSRPLCPVSSSPDDFDALSPGHFLVGGPLLSLPESELRNTTVNRLTRWQVVSQMTQHFWTRWEKEYLQALQTKLKWVGSRGEIKVGDLVWLKEDNTAPMVYLRGRVKEAFPGPDGVIRVVRLATPKGSLVRPVRKLVPLPSSD